jgi:hypothetical protein
MATAREVALKNPRSLPEAGCVVRRLSEKSHPPRENWTAATRRWPPGSASGCSSSGCC